MSMRTLLRTKYQVIDQAQTVLWFARPGIVNIIGYRRSCYAFGFL